MSRQAIREYLHEKHVRYERASKVKKHLLIDEIIETTGLSRKYIINILNGNVTYRARKVVKKLRRIKRIQSDYTSGKLQPKDSAWTPHIDFRQISSDKKISLDYLPSLTVHFPFDKLGP